MPLVVDGNEVRERPAGVDADPDRHDRSLSQSVAFRTMGGNAHIPPNVWTRRSALEEGPAAVRPDRLAGDERALARGEEHEQPDQVLRLLVAADRLVGDDSVGDAGVVALGRL